MHKIDRNVYWTYFPKSSLFLHIDNEERAGAFKLAYMQFPSLYSSNVNLEYFDTEMMSEIKRLWHKWLEIHPDCWISIKLELRKPRENGDMNFHDLVGITFWVNILDSDQAILMALNQPEPEKLQFI